MKQISKEEMNKLFEKKYIFNKSHGIVNRKGKSVGFYRTKSKRYIEDTYVDIAKQL